jgi:hypothetical protein
MASTSQNIATTGYCLVDLEITGQTYVGLQLTLLPNLCTDIILGRDFMRLHSSVTFNFKGYKEALNICNAISMIIEPPSLFPN